MSDKKTTEGKHSPLLMPIEADIAYSKVSDNGLEEYGNRDSWKENTPREGIAKYADAAIRHLKAAVQVGDLDAKSGLPHVYHALWNSVAVVWHYEQECKEYRAREQEVIIYEKQAIQTPNSKVGGNQYS